VFSLFSPYVTPTDRLQSRLLSISSLFLFFYATIITLSPAARSRSWSVSYPWLQWLAYLSWMLVFLFLHHQSTRWLPNRDPLLLPIAGMLCGWGMMEISRLTVTFGIRQSIWLLVGGGVFALILSLPKNLSFLRQYKYIWLFSGLLLTAMTLLFGTNPMGAGPRLWLGCCGFYMQPAEPLKLLLIAYLAAYLSDRQLGLALKAEASTISRFRWLSFFPLLAPTLVMTGLAVLLLLVQRDMGTAAVFLFLYAVIVYLATGDKRLFITGAITMIFAGLGGYFLYDVVRLRVDAWLNPWLDPSGRSFQIVQSLIAVANGGLLGRGPGMGNPGLVPVAHSDFIFVAISEETGLIGAIALILLLGLLAVRGFRAAILASGPYHRLLAAGLTAYLVGQSILIIGGNLRLLPLTGVTLPFVSYGGSSLVTSFMTLALLVMISNQRTDQVGVKIDWQPYQRMGMLLTGGLLAAAIIAGWWGFFRGPDLLTRIDNPRRSIADRYVLRGTIFDRHNTPLVQSIGETGSLVRHYYEPSLGLVTGYTHPYYGQAGLEASLDPILRGIQGQSALKVWIQHILYGQPPPGLDVRTTLDLDIQRTAAALLGNHAGALVMLNAHSGEILSMVSSPSFNPNLIEDTWETLIQDPLAPLLNRATQGLYPTGSAMGPFLLAAVIDKDDLPALGFMLSYELNGTTLDCSLPITDAQVWKTLIQSGCPAPIVKLGESLGSQRIQEYLNLVGFLEAPQFRLPTTSIDMSLTIEDARKAALGLLENSSESIELKVSPLQMALASATLSAGGMLPAPRIVMAVETSEGNFAIQPALGTPLEVLSASAAQEAVQLLAQVEQPIWYSLSRIPKTTENSGYTWFIGGTTSNWQGSPLAAVVLIEEDNPELGLTIGQGVLEAATHP
jgi:cell division protein FtsW (lipid II flippase)